MKTLTQTPLGEIMATRTGTVDPAQYPTETFDLYSIPAFDKSEPDVALGQEIGSTKQVVRPGDVILSKIVPHIRRSWVVGKDRGRRLIASSEWIVFRSDRFHSPYLRHILTSDPFHVQFMGTVAGVGGSLLRARPAQVANLSIPLPPLHEQRRIADILDKADAIRRKRHEAVRLTEEFLPSLFANMFGICGSKYPTAPLNDHLTFITSGSRGWAEHYVPVGKRFLRSLDVQMNRIGTDDVVFVNPPNGAEADRTRVKDGDVLVTITGSRIGRVAFVPDKFGEAYVSQHVSIVRLAASLRPRYCSMFLSLVDGGQRQIAMAQYGQTKPGLSLTNIREFQIPIPPVSEQDRFIEIWTRYEDLAARTIQVSNESDGLFKSLVQRAFCGEL